MASIAIIGSGFVGQANGKVLARQGHRVIFVDTDTTKLAKLREEGYRTRTLAEIEREEHIDIIFIAVPTPTVDGRVQLSFLAQAAHDVGSLLLSRLETGPIVVLKSTVPPRTTRTFLIPLLEKYSGKKAGHDFGVVFEPEYLREATSLDDAGAPRLVTIGGEDEVARNVIAWLRAPFRCPIELVSTEEAEFQKYVHNLFNATKISFFNEMRGIGQALGFDPTAIFEITLTTAEASWNPRYGIRDFGPFAGTCLPKDTAGFLTYARDTLQHDMPLLAATIEVNERVKHQSKEQGSEPQRLLDRPRHLVEGASLPEPSVISASPV